MLNAYFSRSVVINLDRRTDRMELFKNAAKEMVDYQRVSAIDGKTVSVPNNVTIKKGTPYFTAGAWALSKTTFHIFQEAINHDLESVLIMEDDIAFTENCKEQLHRAMLELPDDWELLLLSQFPFRPPAEIGLRYWQRPSISYCCSMYVVRKSLFKEYHRFLARPDMPIDNFLVERIQPKNKCYVLRESIAYQISGASDIDPKGEKQWNIDQNNHNFLVN